MVAQIVDVMKEFKPKVEPRKSTFSIWQPSNRAKRNGPPAVLSEDQQRRHTAARAVVELSWNWQSLGFGVGFKVPEFMASRRQESLVRTLGDVFEERLLLDVVKTWRAFCEWFERQQVGMPKDGWPSVYIEDFLEGVASRSGGATALLTFYRLKWLVKRARAPLLFEDVQIPVVAASGKKGGAQQMPALEPTRSENFFQNLGTRWQARMSQRFRGLWL